MAINQRIDIISKEDELELPAEKGDFDVHLIMTGSSRVVWSMPTIHNAELIELIPVFDTDELVVAMLEKFKEKVLQPTKAPLSRLQAIAEKGKYLFIHNPKLAIYQESEVFLKEGSNWYLTFDQISRLLLPKAKKGSRK